MRVLVGSTNPVKVEAVREAFSLYYGSVAVEGMAVETGVSEQPIGEQTFEGADNRASRLAELAKRRRLDADWFVGVEGGVIEVRARWFGVGAVAILDRNGRWGRGMTPMFELPGSLVKQLFTGEELGPLMDRLTGQTDTKKKGGAIGFLTGGVMDRRQLYVQGIVVALAPFRRPELYFPPPPGGA